MCARAGVQTVTILHEGPGPNPKEAHRAYGELGAGVKVIWGGDLSDGAASLAKLDGASFDAVVDNWSKSPEHIEPYAQAAKGWVREPVGLLSLTLTLT